MLNNNINKIHTPCKNCVFAIYNQITQNGCALNYLDVYRNNNIQILEAYDNEKEFYIINNKKCIGYRENKWFKQFNLDESNLDAKIAKYHETNHLDYLLTIDLKNLSEDQLDDILQQISECQIQPKKVIVIRYLDDTNKFAYNNIDHLLKKYNVQYIWRIQTILDSSLSHENILHNIVSLNAKYRFILSITDYNKDMRNIVAHTNKLVHHDLGQFEVISNENYSCIIFSSAVYRFENFHGKNLLANKDIYTVI